MNTRADSSLASAVDDTPTPAEGTRLRARVHGDLADTVHRTIEDAALRLLSDPAAGLPGVEQMQQVHGKTVGGDIVEVTIKRIVGGDALVDVTAPEPPTIMRHFAYAHLPTTLQAISRRFADLAAFVAALPGHDPVERGVSLRKLLEAKDAAVRAARP